MALGGRGRSHASSAKRGARWEKEIIRGLNWLIEKQSSHGSWNTRHYPTALTALAGTALIASGSTTTQGPYARAIAPTADYLISKCRDNGLIGDPVHDSKYIYGHGFAMLFLSQVLGEEGLLDRRDDLIEVLTKAVEFSGNSQTPAGGWGYVSAREGNNDDEGSTTITQVQGLRGCRNAGIPVPAQVIEKAKQYIYDCKNKDGGISYSLKQLGSSRPAITAAALAALYNAGDYDSRHVPEMLTYAKENLHQIESQQRAFGHWHYTYLYYSQVIYREGEPQWAPFRDRLYNRIISEQHPDGYWEGIIDPVYVTACNLIMLQLDKGYLPIFQR
ncbi:MAG: terpene cyclase/mutase family protein [Pirellulales bacterium]|nr:terpene cyclase/mutase family protein [Pirellulales bacterium]